MQPRNNRIYPVRCCPQRKPAISRCFIFLFSLLLAPGIFAQQRDYPLFLDQSLPRPPGLKEFTGDDFKPDLGRLALYPEGFLYGDRSTLEKLGTFLINDTEGVKLWEKEAENSANILNQWDFIRREAGRGYVYHVSQLQNLSLVYLFTGHNELGQFIRGHLLQIAELPKAFWLHAELRGSNYENNKGSLETSYVCSALAVTLSATPGLFSFSEKEKIEKALREKGLQPCLNWLEMPSLNNWTAVISAGAYAAARYFHDPEGMHIALTAMVGFLDGSIEEDGSYGEGMGYFNYPVYSLLPALLSMNHKEREEAFSSSSIRHSPVWRVYPFLYATDANGELQSTILHFGDNNFKGPDSPTTHIMLASISQDPLASWLMEKYSALPDMREKLLVFSLPEGFPEPASPEQKGLPLLKIFDNGDCFIRSTWRKNGIVLAMRTGDGSRINFAHQRPELGSIAMGAYGEYFIVSSGSASYRSPIHYQWDRTTRAANFITIDDKNQLFPGTGSGSWNTTDVSDFWMSGTPKAEIIHSQTGELAGLLVNEVAQACHVPMKNVRRSALFVRNPGYFVIIDKIEAVDSQHKYSWRIHLNNRDEQGVLEKRKTGHWHFTRPLASLDIYLFSDRNIETKTGEGYMHGPGRDYSPGGVYEGKPGSSIEVEAFNPESLSSVTYYSVFFPLQKDQDAPVVEFSKNHLKVGDDIFIFTGGECLLRKKNQSEKFRLW